MPELPDLHVYAINLRKLTLGKTISAVEVKKPAKLNVAAVTFAEAVQGATIAEIARDGKEMFFTLSNGAVISVHLMLNGRFAFFGEGQYPAPRDAIVALKFSDDTSLAITDFQAKCKVSLNPKKGGAPDVMSSAFTYEYFKKSAAKNGRKCVKTFLITQGNMKGIGNAYADEILYVALISPETTTGGIPEDRLKALYDAIPAVMADAIENMLRIAPDTIAGEERGFLRVHNPKKKRTDEGDPILRKNVDGKSTYYTEKQKLYMW